jgi:hypothetical protein
MNVLLATLSGLPLVALSRPAIEGFHLDAPNARSRTSP